MDTVVAPKKCLCGCTRMTKGGDFIPGHDAKFKSMLIKGIIEGSTIQADRIYTPTEAETIIEERHWTTYLEKRRARPVKTPRAARPKGSETPTEDLAERILRYDTMHAAYDRLRALGLHAGPDKILITKDNCTELSQATDTELRLLSRSQINVAV